MDNNKILDNPKEFFDKMTVGEFDDLLKEFGFDFEKGGFKMNVKERWKEIEDIKLRMKCNYECFDKGDIIQPFDECLHNNEYCWCVMHKDNPMDMLLVPKGFAEEVE